MSHNNTNNHSKKRFGKNLNKIVQASAAPPIVKTDRHSHNGLLVLSTAKKSSGAGGLLATASTSNGAASTTTTNPATTGRRSAPSTHDVLLSAIGGAPVANTPQPDAWGVQESSPAAVPLEQAAAAPPDAPSEPEYVDEQAVHMQRLAARAAARREEEQRRQEEERRYAAQTERKPVRTAHRTLWEPSSRGNSRKPEGPGEAVYDDDDEDDFDNGDHREDAVDPRSSSPDPVVITLKSYEDRNRGDVAARGAAPRMLFDPKSGSMVAVKKNAANGNNGNGKSSKKKKANSRKEILEKRKQNQSSAGKAKKEATTAAPLSQANPSRKFPRTRGVLYKAGPTKGSLVSVDGCDGDDGIGAHAVPGGRIRNPNAAAILQTGFAVHSTTTKTNEVVVSEEKPEPVWISADDNLELVGEEESPQLKPTAKVFAPSQAAMAAIQASRSSRSNSLDMVAEEQDEEPQAQPQPEETTDHVLGCFDDDFIMPPRRGGEEKRTTSRLAEVGVGLDGLDLVGLGLADNQDGAVAVDEVGDENPDSDIFRSTPEELGSATKPPAHGSLFAFGSAGTWGGSEPTTAAANVDWNSDLFASSATATTSFLNISPNPTWGVSPTTASPDAPSAGAD